MKKNIFLSVVASLLMVSCTSDNDFEQKEPISSDIRSLNEALKIAQESLDILNEEYETRGIPQIRSINPKKCKIVRSGSTRSSEGANDTLMYVFNFDDEQGFAIVSAPKNAEDLLAITEIGSFEPDIQTGIEGFDEFILKAKEYCQEKQNTIDDTGMLSVYR